MARPLCLLFIGLEFQVLLLDTDRLLNEEEEEVTPLEVLLNLAVEPLAVPDSSREGDLFSVLLRGARVGVFSALVALLPAPFVGVAFTLAGLGSLQRPHFSLDNAFPSLHTGHRHLSEVSRPTRCPAAGIERSAFLVESTEHFMCKIFNV